VWEGPILAPSRPPGSDNLRQVVRRAVNPWDPGFWPRAPIEPILKPRHRCSDTVRPNGLEENKVATMAGCRHRLLWDRAPK
jgi:hypothetical protein